MRTYCSVLTREGAGGARPVPVAIGARRNSLNDHATLECPEVLRTLVAAVRILTFVTVQVTQHGIAILAAGEVHGVRLLLLGLLLLLGADLQQTWGLVRVNT